MPKNSREAISYIRVVGLFLLLSLGLFSSGCAFTVDKVNVNYRTPKNWPRQFEKKPDVGVTIGTFLDKRSAPSPNWLANKYNGNGQKASGGVEAEKPVAEILRDAVISGLIDANFRVEKDLEKSVLTAKILAFDYEQVFTSLLSDSWQTKLQCEFTLIDNASKQILWKEIVQGNIVLHYGVGADKKNKFPGRESEKMQSTQGFYDDKQAIVDIWVLSIDKVVMELITSEEFRRAVVR